MNLLDALIGHLLRCRDVTRLISQLQEREPTGWEAFRLRAHLAVCGACANFDRQVALLREAMRRYRS
jgi:hypothetical protein